MGTTMRWVARCREAVLMVVLVVGYVLATVFYSFRSDGTDDEESP